MPENEYNKPIKDNTQAREYDQISESIPTKEFSNVQEYEKIPESGGFKKLPKKPRLTTLPLTVMAGAVAGGVIVTTNIVNEINKSSKSEIEVEQVGEDYVSFSYKTNDEGLSLRLHNDFVSKEEKLDYSNKDDEGFYHGSYTFESLKANTEYNISLDGESRFGDKARASKKVKTLKKSYFGEFSVDDSSIYETGDIYVQVNKLNFTFTEEETLSFLVKDESGNLLAEPYIYPKNEGILDKKRIALGETLSEKKGFYYFEISTLEENTEIYRKAYSYGKIELEKEPEQPAWKDHVSTSYDLSMLNLFRMYYTVTFDGYERNAINYVFRFYDLSNNIELDTQEFSIYQEPFELDVSKVFDSHQFRLVLTAKVDGKVEDISDEVIDFETVLTAPEHIKINVDNSDTNNSGSVLIKMDYVDTYNFYVNFSGYIENDDKMQAEIDFWGSYHDEVDVSIEELGEVKQGTLHIELIMNDTTYVVCDKIIDLYHTSLPSEVEVMDQFQNIVANQYISSFYIFYTDLDGDYGNIYVHISVDDPPSTSAPPEWDKTYETGSIYCDNVQFRTFANFTECRVQISIDYQGNPVEVYNKLVTID